MSKGQHPLPESHGPVSTLGVQMLFIAAICVALALVRLAPGLAIPLLIFTILGWFRNRTIMPRRREAQLPTTSWDYFSAFIISCFEMIFLVSGTLVIFVLLLLGIGPVFLKGLNPLGLLISLVAAVIGSYLFVAWILKGGRNQLNPKGKPPFGSDWSQTRFPRSTTSFPSV